VERLAVNVANGADNAGSSGAETAIVPGGPVAYPSTLPLGALVAAVEAGDHPATRAALRATAEAGPRR